MGPSCNLPPGIGAIEYPLKPETKSDQAVAANIVITFETLSGLSLGKWVTCLLKFTTFNGTNLFSTATKPKWDSQYFRLNFAIPSLETMHLEGEPTLRAFSDQIGNCLQDKITSLHSTMNRRHPGPELPRNKKFMNMAAGPPNQARSPCGNATANGTSRGANHHDAPLHVTGQGGRYQSMTTTDNKIGMGE
jgi:hypothetical protein